MQIVGNQQNTAVKPIANILNELVEGNLAIEIHPLDRLIKNKKFRRAENGPGQQNALKLTARQINHLLIGEMIRLGCPQGCIDLAFIRLVR